MKEIWLMITVIVLGLMSTGCGKDHAEIIPPFEASAVTLERSYISCEYSSGKLYFYDGTSVDIYDCVSKTWENMKNLAGICIGVNKDELILVTDEEICVIKDNAVSHTISFIPEEQGMLSVERCIADDNRIILMGYTADNEYLEHRMVLINRENVNCTDLTALLKREHQVLHVNGMDFTDNGQLAVTAKVTTEIDNDDNVSLILDPGSGTLSETVLERCEDGRWYGGYLWYREGAKLKRYHEDTMTTTTAAVYYQDSLASLTDTPWETRKMRMFIEGDNVILVSLEDCAVYIDRLVYEEDPLRILVPDTIHFWDQYEEVLLSYRTENHRNVEVTEIPAENFEDKLTLKLMTGDTDFDLYWLSDVSSSSALSAILDKNQYLPLPDSILTDSAIPAGADAMFRDDSSIFGVPMQMAYYFIDVDAELFAAHGLTVPDDTWTAADLWSLCDEVRELDEELYVFGDLMEISAYLLREWIETEPENKGTLAELAEKIAGYRDVLGTPVNSGGTYDYTASGLLKITWNKALPSDEVFENAVPYPRYHDSAPYRFQVSALLLANPYTENKDAALNMAAMLFEPERVYGNTYHDLYAAGGIGLCGSHMETIGEMLPDLFNDPVSFAEAFGRRVQMRMQG